MSAKLSLKEGEVCGHRTVFQEPWWLDAATNGGWSEVRVERDGRLEGWLPFAVSRDMGFVRCGLPPLTRLLHPIVDVKASKSESLARARFKIESQLIANLPRASAYMFVLSPDHGNALAWQTAGFEARVEHTYVIDAQTPKDDVWRQMNAKTRNLIRRAEDALTIRDLGTDEFVAQYRANLDGQITGK